MRTESDLWVPNMICCDYPTHNSVGSCTMSPKVSSTFTPVILYMETSRGYTIFFSLFSHHINTTPGQHPCRKLWSRAHRRLWLRKGHYEPKLHAGSFTFGRIFRAVGSARDIDHDGMQLEQDSRHFRLCNGYDRGTSRITHCVKARAYYDFAPTQAFTGAVPFRDYPYYAAALMMMQGKRPPRPTHPALTEKLWALMQRCWDPDPTLRPEISEVSQVFLESSVSNPLRRSPICKLNCSRIQLPLHMETVN